WPGTRAPAPTAAGRSRSAGPGTAGSWVAPAIPNARTRGRWTARRRRRRSRSARSARSAARSSSSGRGGSGPSSRAATTRRASTRSRSPSRGSSAPRAARATTRRTGPGPASSSGTATATRTPTGRAGTGPCPSPARTAGPPSWWPRARRPGASSSSARPARESSSWRRSMGEALVIGGGLAGCEAAWQLAERGRQVTLIEMRPVRQTPAHKTGSLAELVCTNSFKSESLTTAHGLLKSEMRALGSILLAAAEPARVAAGSALAVDREVFSSTMTEFLASHPRIRIERMEVTTLPDRPAVIATGPLTSDALTAAITELLGDDGLAFYDAIAPIVAFESIDLDVAYFASRYGKGGGEDYLN